MSDYRKETLNAYKSFNRAKEYKKYHTKDISWARFSTHFQNLEPFALNSKPSENAWFLQIRVKTRDFCKTV